MQLLYFLFFLILIRFIKCIQINYFLIILSYSCIDHINISISFPILLLKDNVTYVFRLIFFSLTLVKKCCNSLSFLLHIERGLQNVIFIVILSWCCQKSLASLLFYMNVVQYNTKIILGELELRVLNAGWIIYISHINYIK